MIRKVKGGYELESKKTGADGKHKDLGTYPTREQAVKREGQVEFFKKHGQGHEHRG